MIRLASYLLGFALVAYLGACGSAGTANLHAPLESAAALEEGQQAAGVDFGLLPGANDDDGRRAIQVAARYRRGVATTAELQVDGGFSSEQGLGGGSGPFVRLGGKFNFHPKFRWFGVIADVIVGKVNISAATASLGLIVAIENPYVVPFVSVSLMGGVGLSRAGTATGARGTFGLKLVADRVLIHGGIMWQLFGFEGRSSSANISAGLTFSGTYMF